MRFLLSGLLLVCACSPAFASGGLSCTGEDGGPKFEINAGVTHGMGGPVFSLEGGVALADAAIASDLRTIAFERSHLAQYWLDGEELRLLLYRERDAEKPHGYVEFTIRTRQSEENTYSGTYAITVFDTANAGSEPQTVSIEGTVNCFAE